MKKLLFITALLLPIMAFSMMADRKAEFKVFGNCEMCEKRIEKAAKVEGVTSADWSQETKMLTIHYDPDKVSLDTIHQKIADAGHDTEKVKAKDEVYNKLPECCKYERK